MDRRRSPSCWRRTLGASSPLDAVDPEARAGRRVAFVGLGSSLFASMDAASALRAGGMPAWAEFASADGAPPAGELVLVAVSASGRTRETVEVAERHRGTSLVIGVTNVPGSPLATPSDVVLPLLAGVEAAGISTLTYRATVVVLGLLAGRFGSLAERRAICRRHGGQARSRPPIDEDPWVTRARVRRTLLDGAPSIDVIGPADRIRGRVAGRVDVCARPRDCRRTPWETADWLHTAVYLPCPAIEPILFPGSPADAEVIDTIAAAVATWPSSWATAAAACVGRRSDLGGQPADVSDVRSGHASPAAIDRLERDAALWRRRSTVAGDDDLEVSSAAGTTQARPSPCRRRGTGSTWPAMAHRRGTASPRPSRRASSEGVPDLADARDRLEVERGAEHEHDLSDAIPAVAVQEVRDLLRRTADREAALAAIGADATFQAVDASDLGPALIGLGRRVADDRVDRDGPLDVVERPPDLGAALREDLAGRRDPFGRPVGIPQVGVPRGRAKRLGRARTRR